MSSGSEPEKTEIIYWPYIKCTIVMKHVSSVGDKLNDITGRAGHSENLLTRWQLIPYDASTK